MSSKVYSLFIAVAFVLLPVMLPDGLNWSLWNYWSNQSAYLAGGFPLKEFLVCLLTALVPLLAALFVFRRKAYQTIETVIQYKPKQDDGPEPKRYGIAIDVSL
jgi:hypothetical protein